MKKIWISGAIAVAASSAYATTSDANLVNTLTQGVTVVSTPTTSSAAATLAALKLAMAAKAATPTIDAVPGAPTTGLLPGQGQLPAVAANYNANALLTPAWGSGEIPASARPDVVGAFRFICTPGQLRRDDPIVYPGQPGKSHLHQFFGNTSTDAYSTYASLRARGDSTCNNILNRSAYWIPAMLNGKGKAIRPDYVAIYYKRYPVDSPYCQKQGKACVSLPRGLRYIFGYNMTTGERGRFSYNCDGPTGKPGHYADIVEAAKNCPTGNRLGVVINGPDCWDGRNLNSANHRSHVAFSGYDDTGTLRCPKTHPYIIPGFTLGAWYTVDDDLDKSGEWKPGMSTWSLSSDSMPGMPVMRPGTSFHTDWMGAWDDNTLQMWMENCINKMLNCSGGDLGNGKQMKMFSGFSWEANPRVVDIPA